MENINLAREGSAVLPGFRIETDNKSIEDLCQVVSDQLGIVL